MCVGQEVVKISEENHKPLPNTGVALEQNFFALQCTLSFPLQTGEWESLQIVKEVIV